MMDFFLYFVAISGLLIGVGLPATIMFMTWITPKSVIEQYVRPPHFSEFEAIAYRYFPSSWIRTLLFTFAISIPFFRRARQFGDMHKQVPCWFNVASRVFVYGVFGYSLVWFFSFLGLVLLALLQRQA